MRRRLAIALFLVGLVAFGAAALIYREVLESERNGTWEQLRLSAAAPGDYDQKLQALDRFVEKNGQGGWSAEIPDLKKGVDAKRRDQQAFESARAQALKAAVTDGWRDGARAIESYLAEPTNRLHRDYAKEWLDEYRAAGFAKELDRFKRTAATEPSAEARWAAIESALKLATDPSMPPAMRTEVGRAVGAALGAEFDGLLSGSRLDEAQAFADRLGAAASRTRSTTTPDEWRARLLQARENAAFAAVGAETRRADVPAGIAAVERYLQDHVSSPHASAARALLQSLQSRQDEEDFVRREREALDSTASLETQVGAYEGYLKVHPQGSMAAAARARIEDLRRRDIEGRAQRLLAAPPDWSDRSTAASASSALEKLNREDYDGAATWIATALQSAAIPGRREDLQLLAHYCAIAKGLRLLRDGRFAEAVEHLTAARATYPDDTKLEALHTQAFRENIPAATRRQIADADRLFDAKDYVRALPLYREAKKTANEHYQAHINTRVARISEELFTRSFQETEEAFKARRFEDALRSAIAAREHHAENPFLNQVVKEISPALFPILFERARKAKDTLKTHELADAVRLLRVLDLDEKQKAQLATIEK